MKGIRGDALRGHLEAMVLSILERGDAHGFEVIRILEERGNGLLHLKEGTLYPALYRLEGAGLIEGEWEGNELRHRGPRRRIYRLTKKGRGELASRRESWREFAKVVGNLVGEPT